MIYEIRPNCYEGMNPTSWQVFETEAHGPGSVVAVCLREGNARRIRDLLNDCTITTANQLATLGGNFTRMMADRDATYERLNAALDRLETMRELLANSRAERDALAADLVRAQAERDLMRAQNENLILSRGDVIGQLNAARSQINHLQDRPQNGSDDQGEPVKITELTEALNTAARCVVLHPDARSAFNLLAKAYRSPGK